ncbi:MAG: 3-carboxy-cis,cis-muconate cycloisomerase [Rhodobacterales bacterium 34-62-10]|nr:MAG: 3-carboxy-cis,cis-muconate cycloisomerase [Rhodobacterales bacterium 34-62-10]
MAASMFDSPLYTKLFPPGEVGRLFTDTAEVRAMLLVEGALAKVQGAQGVIPETAAAFIHRAAMEVQIDPAGLAVATGQNGVSVPGLVAAFRAAMEAPEHAQYAHWGATSQDIIDTGLMLRLRQMLVLQEEMLRATVKALGQLAADHAATPMAARTYGQHATPTSFGASVAHWGAPLLDLLGELPGLRQSSLWVSLSGAAGTSAALGPQAFETRAALAAALGLQDPGRSWHTDRGPVLRIADWQARLALALGKMAEDLLILTQTGLGEVSLGASGASSTMPQKQNPVLPSAMAATARHVAGLHATLQGAALHRLDRDGAAWFTEWLVLPQLCLAATATLIHGQSLSQTMAPLPRAMLGAMHDGQNLIHAEALSFALAAHLPRPEAQAAIKSLCKKAGETGADLADLVQAAYPDLALGPVFDAAQQMGHAPEEARRFAASAKAL